MQQVHEYFDLGGVVVNFTVTGASRREAQEVAERVRATAIGVDGRGDVNTRTQ